jgi:REP element-mobilizing transposase RayT
MGGEMRLNDVGRIVDRCWNAIPSYFPHVALDKFVIMPNHIHGIIAVGAKNLSPKTSPNDATGEKDAAREKDFSPLRGTTKTIGSIVRGFKIGVTKWMRSNTSIHKVWQRNYWERIIRSDAELSDICEYIQNNPAQWAQDKLYQPSQFDAARVTPPTDTFSDIAVGAKNLSPKTSPNDTAGEKDAARAKDFSPLQHTGAQR